MQGKLVEKFPHEMVAGEYCIFKSYWWACVPNGLVAQLGQHSIVLNDDGTITVEPSILVSNGNDLEWHGYLRIGVFEPC